MLNDKGFQVFILSYKRAGKITSDKVFQNAYVVIPQSQEEEYRRYELANGCEYLVMPDEYDGNIARKRNWVLDNFKGQNIVLADDDYKKIGYIERGKDRYTMTPDEIDFMIQRGFIMCEDLGTKLWGINVTDDRKAYMQYTPFNLLSPVLGPFMAIINDDDELRFDERLWLKEDYDFSLQVMHKYRKVLRFNKYHYVVNHITLDGGVVSQRTMEQEKAQGLLLQKKWGKHIVQLRETSINPIVKVPIAGA